MTAYGRATAAGGVGQLVVEMQSVNRRFLEVVCFFPRELACLEVEAQRVVREAIARGQITVRVDLQPGEQGLSVIPNRALLQPLRLAWEEVMMECGARSLTQDQWVTILSRQPDLMQVERDSGQTEGWRELLWEALEDALESLTQMKITEGQRLEDDILSRVATLRDAVDQVANRAKQAPQHFREKLRTRLEELTDDGDEIEDRILREIVVYADKVDITEEVIRIHSHLDQLETIVATSSGAAGKKIEFLTQELLREINTVGSKSVDAEVSHLIVESKAELERIREQVANVE